VRSTCQTRSNQGTNSVVASSAATFSISTKDPLLTVTSVPTSTLMLRFGTTQATPFAVIGPSAQPIPAPRPPMLPAAVDRHDPQPTPDQQQLEQTAVVAVAAAVDRQDPPPPKSDLQQLQQPAPESDPGTEAKPAESSHGIELIIDSLTNHRLTEPISVSIVPLGNELFTASARDLGMQATGNDIGEALIALKQQIEENYDSLNRRTRLDADEKAKLQMLHTYIAPPPASPAKKGWF
jgi:hypothetical protein